MSDPSPAIRPSSDPAAWRRFVGVFAWSFGGLLAAIVGLIFWANPYRNIPFAPTDRPLKDVNQRYLYPAVARDSRFDSAVFGTSSIRLLKPAELEAEFGGRFAELAMNAATAYEQSRIARLFIETRNRNKTPIRTLVFGIDHTWCARGESYERFTERPFPPWMYDDDPWNDLLYLFNGKTVEISGRIVAWRLGLDPREHYDHAGYANFLPPPERYDLARAREHIYGQPSPRPIQPVVPAVQVADAERAAWHFATHDLMAELLALIPAGTRVIVAFPPIHAFLQPAPGSFDAAVRAECKARFVAMAAARPNSVVADFMIASPITTTDENYWDGLHYTVPTASLLSALLGQAARGCPDALNRYAILHRGAGDSPAKCEANPPAPVTLPSPSAG